MQKSFLFLLIIFLFALAKTDLILYRSDGTTYQRVTSQIDSILFTPKSVEEGKEIYFFHSDLSFYGCTLSLVDSICFVKDTTVFKGMKLIPAKGKSFIMGDDSSEWSGLKPAHQVSFTYDFWMDSTEVTQADYDSLMSKYYDWYVTPNWRETIGLGDRYPAYYVNGHDAMLYCNARSKEEGLDTIYSYSERDNSAPNYTFDLKDLTTDFSKNGYRLPTDAEWEYACRAGTTTKYYWGSSEEEDVMSQYEWYNKKVDDGILPVGTLTPNSFGLYDMGGNLSEWCTDGLRTYKDSSYIDPMGVLGVNRVVRGGTWSGSKGELVSAYRRNDIAPSLLDSRGFRCVLKK